MSSLRSRIFVFFLKHRHLLHFRLKRTSTVDWGTSIPRLRQEVERSAASLVRVPSDLGVEPVSIDGLYAEWMDTSDSVRNRAILYFHGGGLVVGSVRSHRGIVSKFVKGSGISALTFEYGLAPEHPFPEGLNDSIAAYNYLLANGIEPAHIVFAGDSGGGNLCLALLLALKDKAIPLPAGAVVMSPWTDLKNEGESLTTNAEADTLCWKDAQEIFAGYYAKDNDPGLPLISPLYGDLKGLPPLLIYAGSDELLRDDSTRFAKKAKDAGVDVTLRIGEGLFHCYPACSPLFPEAKKAMEEICLFIKNRLDIKIP